MKLVTVDIGGTHARFAIATVGAARIDLGEVTTLRTRDHVSFQSAWEEFRSKQGGSLPKAVAIAVAGPINGELVRFTNNPWIVRPERMAEELGVTISTLINDFGAVGHAVARAEPEHFLHITGPDQPLPFDSTICVVGPGTGLGVAHVFREASGGYRVQSTEGGHIDFAPLDTVEDAILARLRQRYRRVSVERIVAGPAIVDIYQTLAAIERRSIEPYDDKSLWEKGTSGEDTLATAAVDRFCLSLGSIAGDLALAQGASGVVIAGGLGLRLRDTLLRSGFADRFRAKGRFERLMASLPVKLITHPQPGLLGAAAAFALEHKIERRR